MIVCLPWFWHYEGNSEGDDDDGEEEEEECEGEGQAGSVCRGERKRARGSREASLLSSVVACTRIGVSTTAKATVGQR